MSRASQGLFLTLLSRARTDQKAPFFGQNGACGRPDRPNWIAYRGHASRLIGGDPVVSRPEQAIVFGTLGADWGEGEQVADEHSLHALERLDRDRASSSSPAGGTTGRAAQGAPLLPHPPAYTCHRTQAEDQRQGFVQRLQLGDAEMAEAAGD